MSYNCPPIPQYYTYMDYLPAIAFLSWNHRSGILILHKFPVYNHLQFYKWFSSCSSWRYSIFEILTYPVVRIITRPDVLNKVMHGLLWLPGWIFFCIRHYILSNICFHCILVDFFSFSLIKTTKLGLLVIPQGNHLALWKYEDAQCLHSVVSSLNSVIVNHGNSARTSSVLLMEVLPFVEAGAAACWFYFTHTTAVRSMCIFSLKILCTLCSYRSWTIQKFVNCTLCSYRSRNLFYVWWWWRRTFR
jgi:hypothetical protein